MSDADGGTRGTFGMNAYSNCEFSALFPFGLAGIGTRGECEQHTSSPVTVLMS